MEGVSRFLLFALAFVDVSHYVQELFAGEDVLSQGGLKVHTTLDLALQEKAEQLVLEDGLSMLGGEDKGEAALVAIDPAQGAVRVLIGGRGNEATLCIPGTRGSKRLTESSPSTPPLSRLFSHVFHDKPRAKRLTCLSRYLSSHHRGAILRPFMNTP